MGSTIDALLQQNDYTSVMDSKAFINYKPNSKIVEAD